MDGCGIHSQPTLFNFNPTHPAHICSLPSPALAHNSPRWYYSEPPFAESLRSARAGARVLLLGHPSKQPSPNTAHKITACSPAIIQSTVYVVILPLKKKRERTCSSLEKKILIFRMLVTAKQRYSVLIRQYNVRESIT